MRDEVGMPSSYMLIGHESIVVRCAEILLTGGRRVAGLISTGHVARSWAARNEIAYVDRTDDFEAFLDEEQFDYLLSLANPSILSERTLGRARKLAINCHNSYLPAYGGVHATAWAILRQEEQHGITWHRIAKEIDAGDIVLQVAVDIAPRETTFTLDGKCFAAAIRSFPELIERIEREHVEFRVQDLSRRSYFSGRKRPVPGGLLDWSREAAALDALVRGLDFGAHANPLGLPKIRLGDTFFVIGRCAPLTDRAGPPGALLEVATDTLVIGTGTTAVAVGALRSLVGEPVGIPAVVERFDLAVGQILPDLEPEAGARLMKLESRLVRRETFWVERLADLQPPTRPRVDRRSASARREIRRWQHPEGLAELATPSSSEPTAEELLLAVFAVFVGRFAEMPTFDLGWHRPDLDGTAGVADGLFARSLPLRVELDAELRLSGLLAQIRAELERLRKKQTYALDLTQRAPRLRAVAEQVHRGLPIAFALSADIDGPGRSPPAALTLVVHPGTDMCSWVYDPARIDAAQVDDVQARFSIIVERLRRDPEAPLLTVPLLDDAELTRVLIEWNPAGADRPPACLHGLIEAQVRRAPDAPAVSLGDQTLTYAQLDTRASRLAVRLRALGVGPEVVVGLFAERSIEQIVGMLGVLKAGGAYLPIDPASPADRVALILDDASCGVVLTQSSLRDRVGLGDVRTLCLDQPETLSDPDPDAPPTSTVEPRNLAYLIYTSGSTGRPKGVLIEHRSVANLAATLIDRFGVEPGSRVLQFASFGFDTSVAEICMALCAGAELCLAHWGDLLPGPELMTLLRDRRITHAALPPSTLAVLPPDPLPDLRVLISSGEACTAELIARWSTDGRRVFNGYGPTETTVCATIEECTPDGSAPPIGRPIPQTRAYILDRWLNVVPVGVAGELHVGGINLARGYHRQPEQTRASFIDDPFVDAPEARLYKTGDICRYLPDGRITFVGRRDDQVKIRGFRIELGEVEAVLGRCDGVEQIAVVVHTHRGNPALAAFFVRTQGQPIDPGALRRFAERGLPEYMIPQRFLELDALPVSTHGKIDRKRLMDQASNATLPEAAPRRAAIPKGGIRRFLNTLWCEMLGRASVDPQDSFFDQGGNSLLSLQVIERINAALDIQLPVVALYQFPTVDRLAAHLSETVGATAPAREARSEPVPAPDGAARSKDIAIVGMAGRFPKAATPEALWHNLREGIDCISFFTDEELPLVDPEFKNKPEYIRAKGIIPDADRFDPLFFGMTPKEAQVMDPQHRLFLEVAHEVLESSGYAPEQFDGAIGVFGGCGYTSYLVNNLVPRPDVTAQVGELVQVLSNDKDYMCTRVAYKLDLTGPAVSMGTACSTSLVALIHAVNSLRDGQCDMALAGGATIDTPLRNGYLYEEEGMHSPDGRCRPFDARAQGTVMSNGVAIVALRRLEDALRDGDHIRAVVRGVGINNDGSGRVSFSAPGVDGQAEAISMAHADAEVDPETISYIEAHGTATPLGDPIEIAALTQAFRARTSAKQFCAIGSIKGNLGHMDTAAGVAGLIKTVLALEHRELPPTLYYEQPNPQIDFENSPVYVNSTLEPWVVEHGPRRAGVSSFGMGGTNAHVIVEEAPALAPGGTSRPVQVILLSAKTEAALEAATANLAAHFEQHPETSLADAAYTLARGRRRFRDRRFAVCTDTADAADVLRRLPVQRTARRRAASSAPEIVFMFPGQGAQYPRMGAALYEQEPAFRAQVDLCAELMAPELGFDIRDVMFSGQTSAATFASTQFAQPAIFTLEYALARTLESWGIRPQALIGHSVGEFVAACLAGVFSLEQALRLIVKRGALVEGLAEGAMLSVRAPAAEIEPRLSPDLSIAADNAPKLCVVSGSTASIARLQAVLEDEGISCRSLQSAYAFHSPLVEPAAQAFTAFCAGIHFQPPERALVSTVTGTWMTPEQATDPAYWGRHLREPVRFSAGIETLWQDPEYLLLEVGPGRTCATLARQHVRAVNEQIAVASLSSGRPDAESMDLASALGRLWVAGVPVDWACYFERAPRRRIPLPTYPMQRRRCWVEPPSGPQAIVPPTPHDPSPEPEMHHPQSPPGAAPANRGDHTHIAGALLAVFEEMTGLEAEHIEGQLTFVELGLDSLLLTQVAQRLQKQFGLRISFRDLLEAHPTLDTLVAHIAEQRPDMVAQSPAPVPAQAPATAPISAPAPAQTSGWRIPASVRAASAPAPSPATRPSKPFGASARIERNRSDLDEKQKAYLADLIDRYTRKTARSKAHTQAHRLHLADPRTVSGFDPLLKELVYPIVAERSSGTRIVDLDGNEYLDVVSGFGSSLFGYLPPFIREAVDAQLERGIEIGPQTRYAGEVAEMICEMTNLERATFCNTGSEAVLGAIRLARTVTGREKIAVFSGAYHGIFDEVLVRGTRELRPIPGAPGVTQSAVDNMLVVDYGTDEALAILEANIDQLAAVLVEPVQSRRPDLQPRIFLHKLRRITARAGVALILDEMITGFRIHQGGAQAHFGVRPDLATYGKIIGGGLPIGVLAGTAQYMDAIDGGYWQYGDDSIPEADITYFAGTFVRHPLAIAAAKAAVEYMRDGGPGLQSELNRKCDALVADLNAFFAETDAPMHLVNFGSLLKVDFDDGVRWGALIYYLLKERGLHIGEFRPFFFTLAHTADDFDRVGALFKACVSELQTAGFLPTRGQTPTDDAEPPRAAARLGRDARGEPAWFAPDPDRPGKFVQVDGADTETPPAGES